MSTNDRFSPTAEILAGDHSDIYLLHALQILTAEGMDPQVVMEIFPRRDGVLCGIEEVKALLRQVLPTGSTIWVLAEGESIQANEVVLRIQGPYQAFVTYETAILGILSQESGWATAAHACVQAAGEIPVIHFGARHVHPAVAPRLEYAAVIGGCRGCTTLAGAHLTGIDPAGTIPHALILCFGDTVGAIEAFDRHIDRTINRIALVDTLKDEAEESLRVARALGERLHGVRLDTPVERGRVTPDLVTEVRARLDQDGFTHVRIIVSGGIDQARIALFCERKAPVDLFGIGSAISSAPPLDFTADIKQVDGKPLAKRGRIPGITPNARLQAIDI